MAPIERMWRPEVPVSLGLTLAALGRGGGDPAQQIGPDGALWRTARTPHGAVTLRLRVIREGVHARAWGAGADWMLEQVPALLGHDDDVSDFTPVHPVIRETWRRLPNLRLPSLGLVFECLVPTVLEQRVTGR